MSLRTLHALNAKLDATLHQFARGDQTVKLLKKTGSVASGFREIAKTKPGSGVVKDLRKAVAGGVRQIRRASKC